ncbi:MAG: hypothetical protein DMF65_14880 [Acidobacteria bacterium]|nr:MAG: hypothetical protein DMF65_14880 [Acidobacteriota bacterium]
MPFGADVQKPAAECDRDGEAREDYRRRVEERVADAVRPRQRASEHQPVDADGVVAHKPHDDAADDEREDDGDDGEQQFAEKFHI